MDPITVNVRHNANQVVIDLLAAAADMRNLATVRALNKTVDSVVVAAARAVRDAGYNLKIAAIKKTIKKRYANQGNLRASVVASGRPIPLLQYGARQTGKGVTVNVLKGRRLIAGAFIATMPSGHQGVYVRDPGGKHVKVNRSGKVSWHQLPIRELFGPSIPDGMANKAVQDSLQQLIADRFPKLLERESNYLRTRLNTGRR